jgi:hypothetical protein
MKPSILIAAILAATPMVALAQTPSTLTCIHDITYSQEFLTRYPKAGAACREVVLKDGQKWVRFEADVVKKSGRRVTVDFIDKFGNSVGVMTIQASPAARVLVDGHELRYSLLRRGDKLSFWMPESRVGFYAAPGASASTQLAVVDTATGAVER